jgi:hypothetical protein
MRAATQLLAASWICLHACTFAGCGRVITTVGETSEASSLAGVGGSVEAGSGSGHGGSGTNATGNAGTGAGAGGGAGMVPPISSDDGKCTFDVLADAHRHPLELYILLDSNLSLAIGLGELAAQGVRDFSNDPRSAGTYVGLRLYGSDCSPAEYQKPTVPVGLLPENAPSIAMGTQKINQAIRSSQMFPAVEGGIAFESARTMTFPERKHSIVVITDGVATDLNITCPPFTSNDVADAAAAGAAMSPPIDTYVVALNAAKIPGLDPFLGIGDIAASGNTGSQIDVGAQDITGATSEALQTVRRRAQPCDYILPPSADATRVSLALVPSTGSGELTFVSDVTACGDEDGWYFDDLVRPSSMVLCPHTCSILREDDTHSITPLTGCKPKKR